MNVKNEGEVVMKCFVFAVAVLVVLAACYPACGFSGENGEPQLEEEVLAKARPDLVAADPTEAWARWYGDVGQLSHEAVGVVVDAAGGVYVAGVARGWGKLCDIVTVKYGSDGTFLWRQAYDGPGKGPDKPVAIKLDKWGDVYVVGWSYGGKTTSSDLVILKYHATGRALWSKRYNSPGNGDDIAHAMALDADGNVTVTGTSRIGGSSGNYDFLTVKYSPAGKLLWARRFASANKGDDYARAIACDASGNVFVTGVSRAGKTQDNYDYLTLKYNRGGALLWAKRYDSPGQGREFARAIATDSSGNVIVAGTSDRGSSATGDFLTIKYNSVGQLLWAKRYDGPAGSFEFMREVVTDPKGNVYVTGYSATTGDHTEFATLKYSAKGQLIWESRYNNHGNSYNYPRSLIIDASGHLYVSGYSSGSTYDYATVKYDSDGTLIWERSYNGPLNGSDYAYALAVDASANVYVTGRCISRYDGFDYAYKDFTTLKYNADGNLLWDRHEVAQTRSEQACAIAVDRTGNTYVAGTEWNDTSYSDYATLKYSPAGKLLWSRQYNGPGNGLDIVTGLAVDNAGNAYVTGESFSGGNAWAYATLKYAADGELLWKKRYERTASALSATPSPLVVDGSGNVYLVGRNGSKYATVKYDPNGEVLWEKLYESGGGLDYGQAIAVDDAGNVYVTGMSYKSGYGYDILTLKYDSLGNALWEQRYNGIGNLSDSPYAIRVDASGNVYITGYSYGNTTSADYVTLKLNPAGTLLWERRYNGPGNGSDYARALAIDSAGNVYVVGFSAGASGTLDYATLKYNAGGELLWDRRYNSPNDDDDLAYAIALDADGNVYVTGEAGGGSWGLRSNRNFTTLKYDSEGVLLWLKQSNGIGESVDIAKAIALDAARNVYVTGSSDVGILTVKYTQ